MAQGSVSSRAIEALVTRYQRLRPNVTLTSAYFSSTGGDMHYVPDLDNNLIDKIFRNEFEHDLYRGVGGSLFTDGKKREQFLAVYSSTALAVNTFTPFKKHPSAPPLHKIGKHSNVKFDRACPMWRENRRPPNLHLVAEGTTYAVGIESRLTEHLSSNGEKFVPAYWDNIVGSRRSDPWFDAMEFVYNNPDFYRHLNATQLIKHAFGLAHTFNGKETMRLYLYWEPENRDAFPEFAAHRKEIEHFSNMVNGASPCFEHMSYRDLWDQWEDPQQPGWLRDHVCRLRERYDVSL